MVSPKAYTFYPVSWDTQKGDIFANFWGVCGKSVPARVRFLFLLLVCVCPTKSVPPKKKRGGHFWWNFRLVKIQVFIHPEWYKGRSYLCDVTLYAYKVFQRGEISKLVFFDYHTVKQLRCLISLYPSLCTGETGRNIGTSNSYYLLYLI